MVCRGACLEAFRLQAHKSPARPLRPTLGAISAAGASALGFRLSAFGSGPHHLVGDAVRLLLESVAGRPYPELRLDQLPDRPVADPLLQGDQRRGRAKRLVHTPVHAPQSMRAKASPSPKMPRTESRQRRGLSGLRRGIVVPGMSRSHARRSSLIVANGTASCARRITSS